MRAPGGRGAPRGAGVRNLDFKLLKKMLKFLMQDYRTVILIIAVCIAVSAAAGVVPAVVIKNITAYMTQGLSMYAGGMSGADVWAELKPQIINVILTTGSVLLIGLAATAAREQLVAFMTQGFLDKMRRRLFDKMQDLPVKYFDQNTHGDIMSIYTNDIDTLRQLISQGIPSIFSAAITLLVLVFIMMYFSIDLMIVVVLGVIGMFFVTKKVGGNSAKYFMKQQQSVGKMEGFIEEMMNGQ
ncbi:MAG: ABC transporter ATP-binding protein, partial [Oscillospiraceae bacterium]|nr:ABC transporter ATP-binding protein [Oscillospiraceae bacterium]